MRTLAFGSCHLRAPIFGRLMKTMLTLFDRLNPGTDFLLIDNASPVPIDEYLPWKGVAPVIIPAEGATNEMPGMFMFGTRELWRFNEAIGHFHHSRDDAIPPRATKPEIVQALDRHSHHYHESPFHMTALDGFTLKSKLRHTGRLGSRWTGRTSSCREKA